MDARRLMENPEKNYWHTYECKIFGMLMKLPWEVKGSYKNKGGWGGSHHAAHLGRHLENYCNEVGHNAINERLLEKSAKRIRFEKYVIVKAENFQVELGVATVKTKRKRGASKNYYLN